MELKSLPIPEIGRLFLQLDWRLARGYVVKEILLSRDDVEGRFGTDFNL